MTRAAPSAKPDTEVVFDPATYVDGVPFDALARLRRDRPVAWVPEIPVLGWPEGPGFWLVLRHADVESVLTRPGLFSSALGATQIRDPATPEALGYVRRMMLNMDPPEHSRLRRLLGRSFTPRAVARLEDKIRGEVLGEVAFAAWPGEHPVADGPRVTPDAVLKLGDRPPGERPGQQPAQPGVIRRVHIEHHLPDITERLRRRRVTCLRGPPCGGKQLRPGQHRFDIRVPQHKPEPRARGPAEDRNLGHPGHGRRGPQPGQRLERHPVDVAGGIKDGLGIRSG